MNWLSSYTSRQIFHTENHIQLTIWEIWICQSTFWTCTGSSILSGIDDRNLKDFDFAIAYLDDIIIFSRTAEEHLSHIKQVFEKLQAAKLAMKLSKCHFFTKEIQYLGHIFKTKGIWLLPLKTKAIQNMYPPKTPKQVHAFLTLVGY